MRKIIEIMKIILPIKTPSLNELYRMHWSARRKLNQKWDWLLIANCKGKNKRHYKNLIILSKRKRLIDQDNFIGGTKGLLDTLKNSGWIKDDDLKSVTVTYQQEKSKKEETILILGD